MILRTLMRAHQETERPVAQASQALHNGAEKSATRHARGELHQTPETQAWTGLTLELSGGCRDGMIVAQPTHSRPLERVVRHATRRERTTVQE
ncbi:MAG: hypothetical protein ACYC9L_16690 [Sulfuricaulis sp.]